MDAESVLGKENKLMHVTHDSRLFIIHGKLVYIL